MYEGRCPLRGWFRHTDVCKRFYLIAISDCKIHVAQGITLVFSCHMQNLMFNRFTINCSRWVRVESSYGINTHRALMNIMFRYHRTMVDVRWSLYFSDPRAWVLVSTTTLLQTVIIMPILFHKTMRNKHCSSRLEWNNSPMLSLWTIRIRGGIIFGTSSRQSQAL